MGCCSSHVAHAPKQNSSVAVDYFQKYFNTHYRIVDEKFLLCLVLVSEFLSSTDTLKLLGLNKATYEQLEASEHWKKTVCKKALGSVSEGLLEEVIDQLKELELKLDYNKLYSSLKQPQNLLENPNGEDGTFDHWNVEGDWEVTTEGTFKDFTKSFCTSHDWASLTQIVEVSESNEPTLLLARTYIASRHDCASKGYLKVVLHFENEETETLESEKVKPPQGTEETGYTFECITLKKVVKPSLQKIEFVLNGTDLQFWAGYFGPRFGYSESRLIPLS